MKQILFSAFCLCLTFIACSPGKKARSLVFKQGIEGRLFLETGNRMPMQGLPPLIPKGLQGTILVYEPTHLSQVERDANTTLYTAIHTKQVASIITDSTGAFRVALPAGAYSLFVQQGKNFYANLFDTANNIALFTVEKRKITHAEITVSRGAVY